MNDTDSQIVKKRWEIVQEYFEKNPSASMKKASEDLGMTSGSIRSVRSQRGMSRITKQQFEKKHKDLLCEHEKIKNENAELKKILFCIKKIAEVELTAAINSIK